MLFEWTDEYRVNVRALDEQHRKLVDMLNELDDLIRRGSDEIILRDILKRLLDYTAYHFVTEERLLERNEYPDLLRHKREHNALSWQVLELRSRYEAGEGVRASEVRDFLTGWLKNHILSADKNYAAFLNSKGVH